MLSGDKRAVDCSGNVRQLTIKPALLSSIVMAVAGMGDALLYAHLPVNGANLGMATFSISLLLSANKFVRIFSNRWIALISVKLGIKTTMKIGAVLAGLTTLTYAFNPAFVVWLLARLLWGFSYSALRFSTLQYAGLSFNRGRALGITGSIREIGTVASYWLGPLLLNEFGTGFTFTFLGIFTMVLLPITFMLPNSGTESQVIKPFNFSFPRVENAWFFVSTFVVEGLLVVGISKILNYEVSGTEELLVLTAFYISFRRIFNIIVAPIAGWLCDRWRFRWMFLLSGMILITGVALISLDLANIGIVTCYFGASINFTLIPLFALDSGKGGTSYDRLTNLVTFRDIGSALGTLGGLYLINFFKLNVIFGILCLLLLFIWFYLNKSRNYERSY